MGYNPLTGRNERVDYEAAIRAGMPGYESSRQQEEYDTWLESWLDQQQRMVDLQNRALTDAEGRAAQAGIDARAQVARDKEALDAAEDQANTANIISGVSAGVGLYGALGGPGLGAIGSYLGAGTPLASGQLLSGVSAGPAGLAAAGGVAQYAGMRGLVGEEEANQLLPISLLSGAASLPMAGLQYGIQELTGNDNLFGLGDSASYAELGRNSVSFNPETGWGLAGAVTTGDSDWSREVAGKFGRDITTNLNDTNEWMLNIIQRLPEDQRQGVIDSLSAGQQNFGGGGAEWSLSGKDNWANYNNMLRNATMTYNVPFFNAMNEATGGKYNALSYVKPETQTALSGTQLLSDLQALDAQGGRNANFTLTGVQKLGDLLRQVSNYESTGVVPGQTAGAPAVDPRAAVSAAANAASATGLSSLGTQTPGVSGPIAPSDPAQVLAGGTPWNGAAGFSGWEQPGIARSASSPNHMNALLDPGFKV